MTDAFWARVEPLIPARERSTDRDYVRKPGAGRKPKPARQVFEAIVYVLRTGCQWKALPKERFGSASAVHKRFLAWEAAGVFEALWKTGLAEYDQMEGIAWRWQSIDGALFKAPLAQEQVGPNPTDRGKKGSKRPLLVDGRGVPLSLVVTGANRHDVTQLDAVLNAIEVKRKTPAIRRSKHLCADAGYRGAPARRVIESTDTSRTLSAAARKRTRNAGIPRRRHVVGWLRSVTAGSTASANCSCAMKSLSAASLRSIISLPRSSRFARSRPPKILFTDKFLDARG